MEDSLELKYIDAEIGGIISVISKLIELNVKNIKYMKSLIQNDELYFECSTIYSTFSFKIRANTSYDRFYFGHSIKNASTEVSELITEYINQKEKIESEETEIKDE